MEVGLAQLTVLAPVEADVGADVGALADLLPLPHAASNKPTRAMNTVALRAPRCCRSVFVTSYLLLNFVCFRGTVMVDPSSESLLLHVG
jgi:hypothetical protein